MKGVKEKPRKQIAFCLEASCARVCNCLDELLISFIFAIKKYKIRFVLSYKACYFTLTSCSLRTQIHKLKIQEDMTDGGGFLEFPKHDALRAELETFCRPIQLGMVSYDSSNQG